MTATIKSKLRVFTANQFINLFNIRQDLNWQPSTVYNAGDVVINSSKRYLTVTGGTSGTTPPTHISGSASDGGVDWQFIEFYVDSDYYSNNIFGVIGKKEPWDDDTIDPDAPQNNDKREYEILTDAIFFKKILENDVVLSIPRVNWTSGVVYDEYDESVENFNYANDFYVMNSSFDIYKCIENAKDSNDIAIPSTSEPTGQQIQEFQTADGYIWKYMGSVTSSDANKFLTTDFIPVRKKMVDDGSVQWQVQQAAIPGAVDKIKVPQVGTSYTNGIPSITIIPRLNETPTTQLDVTITLDGTNTLSNIVTINNSGSGYLAPPLIALTPNAADDGTDLTAHQPTFIFTVDGSGAITSVSIVNAGQYYRKLTSADVTISGGTGAILEPILDSNYILTGFNIINGGSGYDPANDIILVENDGYIHDTIFNVSMQPKDGHGANILEELNASNVIINFTLNSDEGGLLPTTIEFRRMMLVVDPEKADNSGIATGQVYIGANHPTFTGLLPSEIKPGSGSLLYIENIKPIQRSSTQTEDIKFIIKF
jgi:hypothetical protein